MRNDFSKFLCEINSKTNSIQEFYDPLTPNTLAKKKTFNKPKNSACFKNLFSEAQDDENFMSQMNKKISQNIQQEPKEDFFLKKIIANAKNQKKVQLIQPQKKHTQFQPFCFNKKIQIKYPQTPHFKNQLLSPFWKFNQQNRHNIQSLQVRACKTEIAAIQLDSDPLNFVTQPIRYFIGIALKLKQKQCNQEARIFFRLACYVQPYNEKAWKKYIEFQEQLGYIYHSFILSKTAFLFCQTEDFAKSYLSNGQKCSIPLNQMKGIISSVSNPDLYQKGILVQIAKLCLKYSQTWKGLKILHQICIWNQFRLPVCGVIIFLAKFLQNIGFQQKALCLLKKSFGKSMSKLQIYTTYLQIKQRQTRGKVSSQTINQILDYVDFISGENRYKLYLEIAEICFKAGNQNYKTYLQKSYFAAKQFCSAGTGCNKTLRQIFFTVLRWKKVIYPFSKILKSDLVLYESNRQDFVTQNKLNKFQFTDWKYYLHYGLLKRQDILYQASKKWPHTGRLVAQWIHSMRTSYNKYEVLRIWRQKVNQVPKSGQLWCQGGRIYTQLRDFNNASKCFRAAIHFTPQYGDSFIEQLKILLIKSRFKQIQKLKKVKIYQCKLFISSEPFYGHVWSFIKSSNSNYKLSLSQIWEYAQEYIKMDIYKQNIDIFKSNRLTNGVELTAYRPYNQAFLNPDSQQIRVRLFLSYEQIESKN